MFPVATAIQHGAPKINACVLFVHVLRLISTDAFLATHVNARNFNHVNKKEARYKVLRLNVKSGARFNFYVFVRTFIHYLYFICERKFYARAHVKSTRQWK